MYGTRHRSMERTTTKGCTMKRTKPTQHIYTKFDRTPRKGEIRELSRFGSSKVDALGEVTRVDKKRRTFWMRIVAKD